MTKEIHKIIIYTLINYFGFVKYLIYIKIYKVLNVITIKEIQ